MKLNVGAFALAVGVLWGASLFLMTWWFIGRFGVDEAVAPSMLERIYVGYGITPLGSVVGLAWGLFSGTILGGVFASLYNFFADRFVAENPPAAAPVKRKSSSASKRRSAAAQSKRSSR